MEAKKIDFTRSIYTVSGSNLGFESRDMVFKYINKKWGISDEQIGKFAISAGDFQSGANVLTLRINDLEVKILERRIVTEENVDAAVGLNW